MVSPENTNWLFDYVLIENIVVPEANFCDSNSGLSWPMQQPLNGPSNVSSIYSNLMTISRTSVAASKVVYKIRICLPTHLLSSSVENDGLFGDSHSHKETGSKKRARPESCSASSSKARREKLRRDRLNDKFIELSSILEPPERPPKTDKSAILVDAVGMVMHLRGEAQKLKDSNSSLQDKIKELKAEKNELREEKQKLKAEKEGLEQQLNTMNAQPGFLPAIPAAAAAAAFAAQGNKMVPIISYPGVAMWQFMPPAAVDTSQDHVLRPPVA